MIDLKLIGSAVRAYRTVHKAPLLDFGYSAEIAAQTISKIEKGESEALSLRQLERLAEVMGISVIELIQKGLK
jgi:transcriptional regulator with XRE-family HTH domain